MPDFRPHHGQVVHDTIIDCMPCGYHHLSDLPDQQTVAAYYAEDEFYTKHSPPDWFLKEQSEYEAGLWDAYYTYLESLLEPGKPVIDVGCGAGWLVDFLYHRGWDAFGVEPSRIARDISPAKERILPSLQGIQTRNYNVILSLVLEHLPNPAQFLQDEIMPILDGRLIVVVPNEFNRLQRRVGGDWFVSPVHLNYFTPESLRGLMQRAGLNVVHEGATFPMELWLLLGKDYRGNDELGRECHNKRLKLERGWPGVFWLYWLLYRLFGVGRELVFVGEGL